jgi:hypothetical protein
MPRRAQKIDRIPRGGRRPKLRPALANKGFIPPENSPEARQRVSTPPGYHRQGQERDGQPATRSAGSPAILTAPGTPPGPPGVVVFQPPTKRPPDRGPVTYPRFIRQLAPDIDRLVLPDPETGRWPRLHPGAVAEPVRARRSIDWSNRQPSKSAYADWVRDSEPLVAAEPAELLEAAE